MNYTTDIIAPIILFGLGWGAFQYWGCDKKMRYVAAHPEKYSKFTVAFYRRLTRFPKMILALFTALVIPVLVVISLNMVSLFLGFIKWLLQL